MDNNRNKTLMIVGSALVVATVLIIVFAVFRKDDKSAQQDVLQPVGSAEGSEDEATSDGSGSDIQIVESDGMITASEPDIIVPPPTEDEPGLNGRL